MAASSPSISNGVAVSPTPATAATTSNSSKNLRGLNKPKCIKCGNVARSRCPYQSCKSCCAKAQNPCHIHVLKGSSNIQDKALSSNSPLFDQQSTEVSPSGNVLRTTSLRQLSSNFAQFNNLQSPLRSRKPLTGKDAAVLNEWRFWKLKEFKDSNIEAENEAFDHYMQNVNFLEEVFFVNSREGSMEDGSLTVNPNSSSGEDDSKMMTELKLRLRADPIRIENCRKRMHYIVDQGLRKLSRIESSSGSSDLGEQGELAERPKKAKSWHADRVSALAELTDRANKARNEEDLKACLEMKSQLFDQPTKGQLGPQDTGTFKEQPSKHILLSEQNSDYCPPKWFQTSAIDPEILTRVEVHFSSLEDIEDL